MIISKEKSLNNSVLKQENPKVDIKNFVHETTWYFLSHLKNNCEDIVSKAEKIIIDHKLNIKENNDYDPIIDPNLLEDIFKETTKVICTDKREAIFWNVLKEHIVGISSFSILMVFVTMFSLTIFSFIIFTILAAVISFFCSLLYRLYQESHTIKTLSELIYYLHLFIDVKGRVVRGINDKKQNDQKKYQMIVLKRDRDKLNIEYSIGNTKYLILFPINK